MLPYKETYERVKLFGFSFLPLSAVMKKRKILRRMGRSQSGYLHFLDGLPTTDQRLRRSEIQVVRITRGSGKSLCLFAVRVHQTVGFPLLPRLLPGTDAPLPTAVAENSLAVDAACSGNPGAMEYRGVHVASRQEIFHFGPMYGTNNIGEFLAIVHGLALLKQKGFDMPIYSDSVNAINWIKQKKCKTKLPRDAKTEELFRLIERAEKWLRENTYTTRILKWETKQWGEIPADFGRK